MNCFCKKNKPYEICCGAIISGKSQAKTPEELMRSRYSAYVQQNYDYLSKSQICKKPISSNQETQIKWLDLKIIKTYQN